MAPPRYVPLRVADVVPETDDARSFVLEIPADEQEAFAYRAGQYCTVRVWISRGRPSTSITRSSHVPRSSRRRYSNSRSIVTSRVCSTRSVFTFRS